MPFVILDKRPRWRDNGNHRGGFESKQHATPARPQLTTDAGAGAPTARGRTWNWVKFGITSTSHRRIRRLRRHTTYQNDEEPGIAPGRNAFLFPTSGRWRMDDFTDRSQFRIGDLLVVPASLVVMRNGQEIKFEPRWMQVLVMLAEHSGETLSTERLLIEVWGSTVYGDSPVSKTISYIRKSIGDDSRKPRYIETVSKGGYKLIEPVSLPEDYRRMPSAGA
jgi:DNA-binding winged helix-turn-helix (wHTH) protein